LKTALATIDKNSEQYVLIRREYIRESVEKSQQAVQKDTQDGIIKATEANAKRQATAAAKQEKSLKALDAKISKLEVEGTEKDAQVAEGANVWNLMK
jgi:hypothetical protein